MANLKRIYIAYVSTKVESFYKYCEDRKLHIDIVDLVGYKDNVRVILINNETYPKKYLGLVLSYIEIDEVNPINNPALMFNLERIRKN